MDEAYLLTEEEIHDTILEIVSGEKIVELKPLNKVVLLVHPKSDIRLYSAFLEKNNYNQYKEEGFLTEKELDGDLMDNFFTVKDQEELEDLEDKIRSYIILSKKRVVGSKQHTADLNKINNLKVKKQSLLNKKSLVDTFTAEYKAREDRYIYIMINGILNLNRDPLWDSIDSLMDSLDSLDQLYEILNEYLLFYFGKDKSQIRQIARNDFWRNYYIGSSKGLLDSLFNRDTKDLSLDQLNLLSWSSFYADIYEMSSSDRPSEDVISDDDRLDSYLKEYIRKSQAEVAINKRDRGMNKVNRSISAKDSDHVIITAESQDYVNFHKKGLFSDTNIIKNRAKDSTKYNEKEEMLKIKRKRALKNLEKNR